MSGHSKWHNIQAKKGKADAQKAKIFTKIGREIAVAVKAGGPAKMPTPMRLPNLPRLRSTPRPLAWKPYSARCIWRERQ
ncbi:MAG: YebC/PmpR family DNA-binding transcriptional regulator, partial [Clostridia bacterium]|nr:YebC/PmpR family DNA-binding transcriptional regulator [Clostridia bacterium]